MHIFIDRLDPPATARLHRIDCVVVKVRDHTRVVQVIVVIDDVRLHHGNDERDAQSGEEGNFQVHHFECLCDLWFRFG